MTVTWSVTAAMQSNANFGGHRYDHRMAFDPRRLGYSGQSRILREHAERTPPRLSLTLLTGDLIRDATEQPRELQDVSDEWRHSGVDPVSREN